MSYYITKYGKVMAWEGVKTEPSLDTTALGFENKFEDKERAFYFRDRLREEHPRIFLNLKTSKMATKTGKPLNQEDFREHMRRGVSEHMQEFWANLSQLKPRDYVDGWLKAASYGFSRAPTEKEIDEDEKQRQQQQQLRRRQQLIERGIDLEEMEDNTESD